MRIKTLHMLCAIVACSFTALADDGHGNKGNNGNNDNGSFEASVIGSVVGTSVGGVGSGGAPWVVQSGEASISSSGRLRVEVHGLLIAPGGPANLVGTTGPVTMVGATLICGGSGGTAVPETGGAVSPSPLSAAGNAEIEQAVNVPANCFGPVVLVRIFTSSAPVGSQLGAFLALSGFTPDAPQKQNENGGGHDR
jgi:hypothetical protein